MSREPLQAKFVQEVQDWSGGLLRDAYRTPDELRDLVTRGIHRHELSTASTPVDPSEMLQRALAMLPREERGMFRPGGPLLNVVVVGGPAQAILRPVEIERPDLARKVQQSAMFGEAAIFDTTEGSKPTIKDGILEVRQGNGAAVSLDERGSILISVPVKRATGSMPVIIEENVADAMGRALGFASWLLERRRPASASVALRRRCCAFRSGHWWLAEPATARCSAKSDELFVWLWPREEACPLPAARPSPRSHWVRP